MANMHFMHVLYPHMHHMYESIYKRRDEKEEGLGSFGYEMKKKKIRYRIDRVTWFLNLKIKVQSISLNQKSSV